MGTALLDMLVEAGLIDADQYEEALRNYMLSGGQVSTSLLEIDLLKEEQLARFLSRRLTIPFFDPLPLTSIPPEVLALVSAEAAIKYRVLPLSRDRQGLSLAMADPSSLEAMDEIAHLTGCTIKPLAAPEIRLLQALKKYYRSTLSPRDQRFLDLSAGKETPSLTVPLDVVVEEAELEEAEVIEDDDFSDDPELRESELAHALSEVRDRQEVAQILLRHMGQEFERAALFLVRDNEVSGWKAVCQQAEIAGFDLFSVPLSQPSVLKTVVEGKSFYLGPVADNDYNGQLLRRLGGSGPEAVLLVPLLLDGRVVNILYADGGSGELVAQVGLLQRLQEMAGLAFRILILKNKLLRF